MQALCLLQITVQIHQVIAYDLQHTASATYSRSKWNLSIYTAFQLLTQVLVGPKRQRQQRVKKGLNNIH